MDFAQEIILEGIEKLPETECFNTTSVNCPPSTSYSLSKRSHNVNILLIFLHFIVAYVTLVFIFR